ncbi:MAG: hypothetical protein HY696_12420 [Deltaproteobacteria bacterium]|nr:hypothetical protein [Deltaproteobacteria bacterium]
MLPISVEQVRTWWQQRRFLALPWRLYRTDPAWVAPLRLELAQRLNRKKNPYFRKGDAALFLARRGREVVGRISAQVDAVGAPSGAFGFYEAIDDPTVAQALLTAASEWLRVRGVQKMVGPCNFRLEDPAPGFLTEGFEHRPTFMMAYSKPYYPAQMEAAGLQTVMDLHAYRGDKDHPLPSTLIERAAVADRIPQFQVREIQMDRLYAEAELLRALFNEGLKNNWGFVPFSSAHARKMAHDLRLLADPRIILIAEVAGRPVGAVINLPNFNDLFADCNGRLFPKGFYRMWRCRNRIQGIRGYAIAILPEYQKHGVGCLLLRESFARAVVAGYTYGEISWILGSNKGMNDLAVFTGSQRQKAYRLYEQRL